MSKGVVIGHVPGSTEYLNQSSSDVTKWIFSTQTRTEIMNTFAALLEIQGMSNIVGWYIERDHAPRSGAAKELEMEVFRSGSSSRAKKPRQRR